MSDKSGKFQSKILAKDAFMCRGIYYLYKGKEVVYVGMSTTNCLQRIVMHQVSGRKDFDSFQIYGMPKSTDFEICERERAVIQRKLPKYNVAHARIEGNQYWKTEAEVDAEIQRRKFAKLSTSSPPPPR